MSLPILEQLQSELRRLYIAGSDLAADDYRLERLEPELRERGERAPVFKRLAEGVAALAGPARPEERAAALQDVSLLLNSVLSTQGNTEVGNVGETPVSARAESRLPGLATDRSSRELAELRQALYASGSGRYETVRSAYKNGLFRDLRSLPLALRALGDPYSEISDLAAERILPDYGPGISALLLDGLDIQGGREEERKLQVVQRVGIGPEDRISLEKIIRAAEKGSDKIRVAAIVCLGADPSQEEKLLEWSRDKKKPVRKSAYAALTVLDSEASRERLYEAISGPDAPLAAEALAGLLSPGMAETLAWLFEERLRNGTENGSLSAEDLQPLLIALEKVRHPALERLYTDLALNPAAYPSIQALNERERGSFLRNAAYYLRQLGTFEALELVERLAFTHPLLLQQAIPMARGLLTPSEVYERYMGTNGDSSRLSSALQSVVILVLRNELYPGTVTPRRLPQAEIEVGWDPRWLDWAIDQDHAQLVIGLARPGNDRLVPYLEQAVRRIGRAGSRDEIRYFLDMLEAGLFDEDTRYELFMRLVEARNWNGDPAMVYRELDLLKRVPAERMDETIRRLEALIEGISISYKKKTLQEVVDALRARRSADEGDRTNE
ncbi:hypothetical protein CDO73_05410 [Saccharibacillus sp. O23]|uniref:hypothetical protein n=1 Tax=Saccharibacillus sp. O23 TaxID=2009338 RepID=UPI000B4E42B0|nr:hypothetical protein [Saccharibacillus sp. O23]OWR31914.1 hypothetical protein CDO73_05410 [Saccharibacillus sp. O23]